MPGFSHSYVSGHLRRDASDQTDVLLRKMMCFGVLCLLIFRTAMGWSELNAHPPQIISPKRSRTGRPEIHGTIGEDKTVVKLQQRLIAIDADEEGGASNICRFIVNEHKKRPTKSALPFEVRMKDGSPGEGEICVKEGMHLDFARHHHYRFHVAAEDCGTPPRQSKQAVVFIKVKYSASHEVRLHSFANAQAASVDQVQQLLVSSVSQDRQAATSTCPLGMAAIVVVCVGFLVCLIILGVIGVRVAYRRKQVDPIEEKQEMEWDTSAEEGTFEYEDKTYQRCHYDSEADDDDKSMQDDCGERSENEPLQPSRASDPNELEWDHSSLEF